MDLSTTNKINCNIIDNNKTQLNKSSLNAFAEIFVPQTSNNSNERKNDNGNDDKQSAVVHDVVVTSVNPTTKTNNESSSQTKNNNVNSNHAIASASLSTSFPVPLSAPSNLNSCFVPPVLFISSDQSNPAFNLFHPSVIVPSNQQQQQQQQQSPSKSSTSNTNSTIKNNPIFTTNTPSGIQPNPRPQGASCATLTPMLFMPIHVNEKIMIIGENPSMIQYDNNGLPILSSTTNFASMATTTSMISKEAQAKTIKSRRKKLLLLPRANSSPLETIREEEGDDDNDNDDDDKESCDSNQVTSSVDVDVDAAISKPNDPLLARKKKKKFQSPMTVNKNDVIKKKQTRVEISTKEKINDDRQPMRANNIVQYIMDDEIRKKHSIFKKNVTNDSSMISNIAPRTVPTTTSASTSTSTPLLNVPLFNVIPGMINSTTNTTNDFVMPSTNLMTSAAITDMQNLLNVSNLPVGYDDPNLMLQNSFLMPQLSLIGMPMIPMIPQPMLNNNNNNNSSLNDMNSKNDKDHDNKLCNCAACTSQCVACLQFSQCHECQINLTMDENYANNHQHNMFSINNHSHHVRHNHHHHNHNHNHNQYHHNHNHRRCPTNFKNLSTNDQNNIQFSSSSSSVTTTNNGNNTEENINNHTSNSNDGFTIVSTNDNKKPYQKILAEKIVISQNKKTNNKSNKKVLTDDANAMATTERVRISTKETKTSTIKKENKDNAPVILETIEIRRKKYTNSDLQTLSQKFYSSVPRSLVDNPQLLDKGAFNRTIKDLASRLQVTPDSVLCKHVPTYIVDDKKDSNH